MEIVQTGVTGRFGLEMSGEQMSNEERKIFTCTGVGIFVFFFEMIEECNLLNIHKGRLVLKRRGPPPPQSDRNRQEIIVGVYPSANNL